MLKAHFRFNSALFYLLLTVGLAVSHHTQAMPATPVNVVVATLSEVFPTRWVSGSVISNNDAKIAAQINGRLLSLAQVGDRVRRGEVLATIDDRDIQLQIQTLKANVQSKQRRYLFLVNEVKRLESLTERKLSAKTELDQVSADRDIARAELAYAKAELAQSERRLTFCKIKAPFDGVISKRLSQLGEVVDNGVGIVQLVETVNLEVSAQVPLATYPFLQPGQALEISSEMGKITAPIRAVVPVAAMHSHLIELRLSMAAQTWPVGLSVRVAVPQGHSESLLVVPRDAVVLRRDGNAVYVIDEHNVAQQVAVELGFGSGSSIAIRGAVKAGDQVVIRGAERLRPGQKVAIKDNNDALFSMPQQ